MSEKKAKEKRREEGKNPNAGEKPLFEYKTAYFRNGDVMVTLGFPANYDMAMTIAHASSKCIMDFFLDKAKSGKIDQDNNVVKASIIESANMATAKSLANFIGSTKKN